MPNVVKGSKQEKMVVVPYRPWRRLSAVLAIFLLLAGSVVVGYWYGVREASDSRFELVQLRQRVSEAEAENGSLRQELATLDRAIVMDDQTNDEIQGTIAELREYASQLEQDNAFYRQAMTSEFEGVGLVIGQMELQSTPEEGRYRYKLVLRQEESDGLYLTGHVNVEVVGERAGEQVVFALRDISEEQELLDIRLRFRYFQDIEGELVLPADFEPRQININAVATAPMAKSISKSYNWAVEGE